MSSSYDMLPAKDFIQLACNIVGKTRKCILDTGIYKHNQGEIDSSNDSDDLHLDLSKDIFVIKPKHSKYIELEDLLRVFNHMDRQFKNVDKTKTGQTYFYQGLDTSSQTDTVSDKIKHYYSIDWGSR